MSTTIEMQGGSSSSAAKTAAPLPPPNQGQCSATRPELQRQLEASNYGSNSDYGSSGYQTELGVNYYINKNSNKMQLAYQYWRGEGGGAPSTGDAKASIVRLQWQLVF